VIGFGSAIGIWMATRHILKPIEKHTEIKQEEKTGENK
jgi:hypothetical protein